MDDGVTFSLSPIIKILKILGVSPVFILSNKSFKTFLNYFFALISIFFWSINFFVRFANVQFLLSEASPITEIGVKVRTFLPFQLVMMIIFAGQIFKSKYREIAEKLSKFDKKVCEVFWHF